MIRYAQGAPDRVISQEEMESILDKLLEEMGAVKRLLFLPPDFTRYHSGAGEITAYLYKKMAHRAHVEILPALGTHVPMTEAQLKKMFPGVPLEAFRIHDWRNGVTHLGDVPGDFIQTISEGKVDYPVRCEINRSLVEGEWNRIFSIGQLIPHEVVGIANHSKNVFVGTGGKDNIDKSHFLGAVYGMERMMGRAESPVRQLFDYMSENFLANLPITYLMTVRKQDDAGDMVTRGFYAGDDSQCFHEGAKLCRQVNLDLLDNPIETAVVYLCPDEFGSTWLGNKAVYRTRMAMADGGRLIILAPGVDRFGEDGDIDVLVRKYGYHGTEKTLAAVEREADLGANLSAAAHLIHGSSEGRFSITYCPGGLSREEVEGAGFAYADLDHMVEKYSPEKLRTGWNTGPDGEDFFFVANPAQGLWGLKNQFA